MAEVILRAACSEFLGAIMEVNRKSHKFNQTLRKLQAILLAIAPEIKGVAQLNNMLERREETFDLLMKKNMETGTKLVRDCSKIHWLNCLAKARYQAKLEEIEWSLVTLFSTIMQARMASIQLETLVVIHDVKRIFHGHNTIPALEGIANYMITARDLCIAWADTPMYWTWIPVEEANSSEAEAESEVAKLIHVCWLDIRGKINISILSRNILYGAFFVFKQSREGAFGFDEWAVEVSVKVAGLSDGKERTVHLIEAAVQPRRGRRTVSRVLSNFGGVFADRSDGATPLLVSSGPKSEYDPRERTDGWMEVELGEFSTHGEDKEVEMRVCEVSSNTWKGGILVKGFEIRPKVKNYMI